MHLACTTSTRIGGCCVLADLIVPALYLVASRDGPRICRAQDEVAESGSHVRSWLLFVAFVVLVLVFQRWFAARSGSIVWRKIGKKTTLLRYLFQLLTGRACSYCGFHGECWLE